MENLKIEQIEKIYNGQDKACRCGCKGSYAYDEKKIKMRLNRALKLVKNGEATPEWLGSDCINVSFGDNRAITIYLKEA